jgi:hypothetical protein
VTKILGINNLIGGIIYFSTQFQKVQSMAIDSMFLKHGQAEHLGNGNQWRKRLSWQTGRRVKIGSGHGKK